MTRDLRLSDLDDDALLDAYAPPRTPWLRLNFVTTVDGSVRGSDGTSNSINNDADHRVFDALRALADVVVVGAGTVRDEGYRPMAKPLVVVSRSGVLPPTLLEGDTDNLFLATASSASGLAQARSLLGRRVLVLGEDEPDLAALRTALVDLGFGDMLCEGGPRLAGDLLAAGLVDEMCCTIVPRLVGGHYPRILSAPPVDVPLELHTLLQDAGTLLGRWFVEDQSPGR